jgi:hypothetical protein
VAIGAQTQLELAQRALVEAPASERDGRRQLMRRWICGVVSKIRSHAVAADPPGAQLHQSVLKRRRVIGSWLCHESRNHPAFERSLSKASAKPNEAPLARIA